MPPRSLDAPGWERALGSAFRTRDDRIGWTDTFTARLGNGDDPGVYVVETADREYQGQPCMWVHKETENGYERSQAINDGTGGIPFNNNNQPMLVKVGKPPGEDRLFIMRPLEAGLSAYKGPPLEAQIQQAAIQTPDKQAYNTIYHVSGMVVGLRAGQWRKGNTDIHNPDQNASFVNLSSPDKRPTTTGKDKWVLIGQDSSGAAVVTEGEEFDTADASPLNYLPIQKSAGVYYFGRARLTYGDTDLTGKLTVFPDMAYVGNDIVVQSTSPGALGAYSQWVDTSRGTGAWRLNVRNASNSNWEGIIGAGGTLTRAIQTADKTIANTTDETTLIGTVSGDASLPENTLAVGTMLHITAGGHVSDTGTPNLTIIVTLGGVEVLNSAAIALGSGITNVGWSLDVSIVCRTVGATGTVVAYGTFVQNGTYKHLTNTSTATIDTTATLAVDVTATWGTASASNTITSQAFLIESKVYG